MSRKAPGALVEKSPVETKLSRWMEAMTESLRAINGEQDLPEVLAMIARQTCELLSLQQCSVWVLDPESGIFRIDGSHGLSPGYIARSNTQPMRLDEATAVSGPPTARAALTGQPIFVRDVYDEPGLDRWRASMAREGLRSVVAAPMRSPDKSPVGTLTGYGASERSFNREDLEQLALLSDHAAAAILAARRRQREREAHTALSIAHDELRTQQATVSRLRDLQNELTRLLLDDVGLDGIAAFLAGRLDATIMIDSEDGTELAASPAGATVPAEHMAESEQIAEALDSGRATEIGTEEMPICLVPIPGVSSPRARIWVIGNRAGRFDEEERQSMEGCALLIALERTQLERQAEAEARLTKDLLADLLSPAAMMHADSVMARALNLGHDPQGRHTLIAFVQMPDGTESPTRQDRLTKALLDAAHHSHPRPVIGAVGDAVVALLRNEAGSELGAHGDPGMLPTLVERARQVTGGAARCIVGARDVSLRDVEGSLTVALRAGQLVTSASPSIIRLADFGVHGLLLESATSERLAQFASRTLSPLRELDAARQIELVETLRTWFDTGMSAREAAAQLFVHPNTVGYRLKRAASATDLDLNKPGDLMTLQLALMVDQIRGGVTAPTLG